MSEPYRSLPPREGDADAVVVGTRRTALDAEMAREYLKSHGIVAGVQEPASFNPIMSEVLGGTRILVRGADAERARSLLARLEKAPVDEDDGDDGEVRCPRCELAYCFYEKSLMSSALGSGGAASGLSALAALVLTPFAKKRWVCHKCLHVWDDAKAGPARATRLDPDDPRPVFRLRRGRGGTGLFVGLLVMCAGLALIASEGGSTALMIVCAMCPIVGIWIGRSMTTDVCSAPGCRAELERDASKCPVCGGLIAGVITSAPDHYAEAAAFRRDLVALNAEAEKKAQAKAKKRAFKKKERRAAPDGEPTSEAS